MQHAAHILRQGGVVAYATESCFGLGCDPRNPSAIKRVLRLKRRPMKKGLLLIAADVGQLQPYCAEFPPQVLATWPGAHTWLLPAKKNAPRWIMGNHARIALRVTAHRQAAALCHGAGMAIVSTSANRSGEAPSRSYRETVRRFRGKVDYILPGHTGGLARPSAIMDAKTGKTIRAG
jgi:L-threonylcarbamoyladenylate synthase